MGRGQREIEREDTPSSISASRHHARSSNVYGTRGMIGDSKSRNPSCHTDSRSRISRWIELYRKRFSVFLARNPSLRNIGSVKEILEEIWMIRNSIVGNFNPRFDLRRLDHLTRITMLSIFLPRWNLIWFKWIYSFFKTGRKMKTRDKLSYLIEMVWRGERLAERILRVNSHGMRMGSWRIRGRHSPRRMSKRLLGDIPGFLFTGRWKLSETFRSGRVWFNFLPDASHSRDPLPSCCVLASISSENRFDRKICSRYYWTRRE